jgi:hypothetical protein
VPAPPQYWDKWDTNEPAQLAKYATTDIASATLRAGDLEDLRTTGAGRREANVLIAEQLYERIRAARVPYSLYAWEPTGGQRIRDAAWILEESATCLDLALLYAGMCINRRLRPYIALLDPTDRRTVGHAIVLVDPAEGADLNGPGAISDPVTTVAAMSDKQRRQMFAVDITLATRGRDQPFSEACAAANSHLDSPSFAQISIVDVVSLQRSDMPPLRRPLVRSRPALRPNLPEPLAFHRFDTRAAVHRRLLGARGTVVLHGPSGTGKSTLALQVARSVDDDCGWFLAATDPSTLQTALAHAEARESDPEMTVSEPADVAALASAARQRLSDSETAWVVVIDNADSDPGRLERWLPHPNPHLGQAVIITTTNDQWLGRGRGYIEESLQPLDPEEVRVLVQGSDALVDLIAGRPLLAVAFRELVATEPGALAEVEAIAATPGDNLAEWAGPTAYWRGVLLARPEVRSAAEHLAWLAPDSIDRRLAAALAGSDDIITALVDLGVLAPRVGARALTMHRLVGGAIRRNQSQADRRAVAFEVARSEAALNQIDQFGDQETMENLTTEISAPVEDGGLDAAIGVALARVARGMELLGFGQRAVDVYRAAIPHLRQSTSYEGRELLAEALHGSARGVKDYETGRDDLDARLVEAMLLASEARTIRAGLPDEPVGHREVLVARSDAMVGVLRKEQRRFPKQGETELAILIEAKTTLEQSYETRQRWLTPSGHPHAEVARALYNLAGIRIDIAKLADRNEAEAWLDESEAIYRDVLAQRTVLYPRGQHPHVAACHNGLGIVDYYRAILLAPKEDWSQEQVNAWEIRRNGWLRSAMEHVLKALADRQDLDGDLDLEEASESFSMLSKITFARQTWARLNIQRAGRRTQGPSMGEVFPVLDDFRQEMVRAGVFDAVDAAPNTWSARDQLWTVAPRRDPRRPS